MLEVSFVHRFARTSVEVSFMAPTPGTTVLFGPSGAGKSTVVAVLAGLLRPAEARIAVDGDLLCDTASGLWLPPERRRLGVVFQEPRLFPHLSVDGNLRYGLRRALPGTIGFDDVLALLGLGTLLARRPHTLSGGERQRVAIGRALLAQPRLLLMDEPLASLDAARKAEILPYLARLKSALTLPIVYVTHAMDEVARLADTLVLIDAGRSIAAGPLREIAARADLPLAARDDAASVLDAVVQGHDAARRLTSLRCGGFSLLVPLLDAPLGKRMRVRVPAREVLLATRLPEALSVQNAVPGQVRALAELDGAAVLVEVELPGGALLARVTPDAISRLALARGVPVIALVKSMSVEVLA